MPQIVTCPDCDKKLRVPDHLLGKKVRCPGCSAMFTADTGGDTDRAEGPRPSRAKPAGAGPEDRIAAAPGPGPAAGKRPAITTRADVEEGRPRPRRRAEDDEDERPRSRRRRDEEEEDEDHPRRPEDEEQWEDEEDPEEARLSRKSRNIRAGWKKVRMGLNLVAIAGWVTIGMIGLGVLSFLLIMVLGVGVAAGLGPSPGGPPGVPPGGPPVGAVAAGAGIGIIMLLFSGLAVLVNLAENALRLTGMGLCMAVPNKRRTPLKGLAIAAFSCAAGSVVLTWMGNALNWSTAGLRGANPMLAGSSGGLGLLGLAAWLAGFIVFLFFLRSVAQTLREHRLAQAIVQLMIAYAIAVGVTFMLTVLLCGVLLAVGVSLARSPGGAMFGAGVFSFLMLAFWGVALVVFLVLFIRYILVVQQVREAVDDYLQGS